nr:O-antigen ligase family protein [uncultured Brumimicrobium sp.]
MNLLMEKIKQIMKEGPLGIYLMAFLIPLNAKWLGFGVLIIILEQIIRRTPIRKENIKKQLSLKNPGLWLFLFYFMHIVGLIHTENMAFANMDLGMKATLAIFPVFFLLYQPLVRWSVFVKCFVFGAFASILVNVALSMEAFLSSGAFYYMRGSNLSQMMHRGYWAVYLLMAYLFLLKMAIVAVDRIKIFLNLLGALFIAVFVVLSESKVGYLLLAVISIWEVVKFIKAHKNKWLIPIAAAVFVGGGILVYALMPSAVQRISKTFEVMSKPLESYDKTGAESTTARLFVWDASVDLIKENFWFGVGTGDIKDELRQRNLDKGYTGVAQMNLNSHNQFLNSHVAIGVFGSLFLLMTIVSNLFKFNPDPFRSWRLGIVFILFIALLPESMLEVQAGIIPYAFFLTFLTAFKPKV